MVSLLFYAFVLQTHQIHFHIPIGDSVLKHHRTVENICLKFLLCKQLVARDLRVISVTGVHRDCQ